MTHVSLTRVGPNAIGEQVNAVFIQPTLAYVRGLLRFLQTLSRYDAVPLPQLVLLYIMLFTIMRDLTRTQIWHYTSIGCIVR
jgi:hypothetical protein